MWLKFGGREARGLRPPRTPLLFWEASPPGPPKRRSAPLVAAVVRFLATEPLVRGSFAAWGRTFSEILFFLNKPLVRGSFAAWGQMFFPKHRLRLRGSYLFSK